MAYAPCTSLIVINVAVYKSLNYETESSFIKKLSAPEGHSFI